MIDSSFPKVANFSIGENSARKTTEVNAVCEPINVQKTVALNTSLRLFLFSFGKEKGIFAVL